MQLKPLIFGLLAFLMTSVAQAQSFTYQGFLKDGGNPANGNYSMTFRLFSVPSGGTAIATVGPVNVSVANGLFTHELNFGSVWDGADRYLEIQVGAAVLAPRIKINPTPYAIRAATAGTANPIGAAGGDLSGSYPNPMVTRLQGRSVANNAPNNGEVLKWNGSAWAPATDLNDAFWQQSGNTIFYTVGNVGIGMSSPAARLHVESDSSAIVGRTTATSGAVRGVYGQSDSTAGTGIYGFAAASSGLTSGVYGASVSTLGRGVFGTATATTGVNYGVYGRSASTEGTGVFGYTPASSGSTAGVYGLSDSNAGRGVFGVATSPSGPAVGGRFETTSTEGTGVIGLANATTGVNFGIYGLSASTSGTGIYGEVPATSGATLGVQGRSASTAGTGVFGAATAASGTTYGGRFESASTSGRGVFGAATAASGTTYGGRFESASTSGRGVFGWAVATTGVNYGGWFQSNSIDGRGVYGSATAMTGITYGVYGVSASTDGTGVYGYVTANDGLTEGVYGRSDSAYGKGVHGSATATTGMTYGVYGVSASTDGTGVYGFATATSGATWGVGGHTLSRVSTAYGVIGQEPSGGSGHAVYATGTLAATGTKSFQIDHPLSPETHYLNHFCTEGPEPYNAYSGNIVTDAQGYAVVQLPDYFETINRDFRYQLTVVDDSEDFVLAKVVRKIQNNRFVIRTSKPYVEVSWEVKAIRNDRWVQEYGFQTEQAKEDDIKGKYLHPELYGQPKERGIHYRPDPERPSEVEKP